MKRIICIIMAAVLCMTAFVGCGKKSKDPKVEAYENWDCAPLIELTDKMFSIPEKAVRDDVIKVLGEPDKEDSSSFKYSIKVDSYLEDTKYNVKLSVSFDRYGTLSNWWITLKDEDNPGMKISSKDTDVWIFPLCRKEVKESVKKRLSDWEASGTSDYKKGKLRVKIANDYIHFEDTTNDLPLSGKENTSDGKVGDNNGDGKVDEKDWEVEWKDYLDKKMN